MTINYGTSEFTQSHRTLMALRAKGALCSRGRYYRETLLTIFVSGAGAVAAFRCATSIVFFIVALMLTGYTVELLYRWRPYDRWLQNHFFPGHLNGDLKHIRLEITDEGLREHQGDIVPFVPWKDVLGTILEGDILVIELSSGQEAVIPRKSFGISELNLEEIRSCIDRQRIPNDRDG